MSDALEKLNRYKDYLFHGSPFPDIKVLNPNQARDLQDDSFNTDYAVFATDNICLSIIHGLVNLHRLPKTEKSLSWSAGVYAHGNNTEVRTQIPNRAREYLENDAIGYVYIVPKDSFLETDGIQWKSKNSIEPIDCIKVSLEDFYAMGGKIEWQ